MDPALPKAQLVAIKNGEILNVARNDSLKDLRDSKQKWSIAVARRLYLVLLMHISILRICREPCDA